jgi:DOPA 4,5-dioxygenase
MTESASAARIASIKSYHTHIYFRSAEERERALQIRSWIDQRFLVQLGRVHEVPIGPHTVPMYQVAFACEAFASFVPWLMLNRRGLSVLVHPNTGRALDDHLVKSLWLGEPLAIRSDVLSNAPEDDVISPIEPNTKPQPSSE